MAVTPLRLVFAPWGVSGSGEDVWLFENALIFGVERIVEAVASDGDAGFADLYGQLQGDASVNASVPPYSEADIYALASRCPADASAIVDGAIVPLRELDRTLVEARVAPRMLILPERRWFTPDAFVFDGFAAGDKTAAQGCISRRFHGLALAVAEALLAPFEVEIPASIGPEYLTITENAQAFALFLKGKRLARTSEEKLGYYRQAIKLDPAFYWALFNAGQLLKAQADYTAARRHFLAAADSSANDPAEHADALFELGLCSIHLGDTKTARNFWDEALRHAPNNATLIVNIAGTYEQEEDWRAASELHERALQIAPNYHKAIVSLARLKAALGKMDDAIRLYERALALQPDDALREAILGGCFLAVGDEYAAKQHLRRAAEMDPPRERVKSEADDDSPAAPGDYARAELANLTP